MSKTLLRPKLLLSDSQGNIYDHPDLLMLCRRGSEWALPRPDDLILLPPESELFLLPGRAAVGLDPETGEVEELEDVAVAAFVAPAYTLTAHPVYATKPEAPLLPLFAYGAVGFLNDRFYVAAKKVDSDPRQIFTGITPARLHKASQKLLKDYPKNRLMQHLMLNCVQRYSCPAAKNLCLGRYEAPLPVSHVCNAKCLGCISHQSPDSPLCATPQNRLTFTPTAQEIVEVMQHHASNASKPIFSFGQGCEGEPLTEAALLIAAITQFRAGGGQGTVNLNSNASLPKTIPDLATAGLTSLRVSLNSARDEVYNPYYRPSYALDDVKMSMRLASEHGIHLAINLLFFPGITDTEAEVEALIKLCQETQVKLIQLRNLNIDPEYYLNLLKDVDFGPNIGLHNFCKRLKRSCPELEFGYFNPFIEPEAAQDPTIEPKTVQDPIIEPKIE